MKLFSSICICMGLSVGLFAQHKVQGLVMDAQSKLPLTGAIVFIPGQGGTTSDKDGFFYVDCGKPLTLTVSYIGYELQKRLIKNCTDQISVELVPTENNLNTIEITATSNLNKSLLYQPVSITRLVETELKRGNGLFLDDAINGNVPGVTMQRRAVSSGQSFNIRGYGNGVRGTNGISSNFDGQGSKVYLNGIPITDAEGITQMDDIDFGSVGNAEITKGPSGTLYGLAIAGVVNLKTVKPEKGRTSIGQDILTGSYGLRRFTTHFETAGERSSLLINYGSQQSDGFMSHNASRKQFVNIAADFQANEKQSINTYFGFSNSYDERGGEATINQYNNFDYSGNPDYIKRNAHSEVISFRAGLSHNFRLNSHVSNTTTLFGSGVSNNASSAGGWTDKTPLNYGVRTTVDLTFPLKKGYSISSISGMEFQQQNAQVIGYNMVANPSDPNAYWIIGAMKSNQSTVSATASYFTEWTLAMPNDFSITAGLGISNMRIELNDKFYVAGSTSPTQFSANYNGLVSPHVAVNKVFSKQFSVYASYSKGYKAPVSAYFFIPATGKLNTGLKPEIGNQFEIGTKGVLLNDKLSYQFAMFKADFTDKMTAIAVPLNGSTTTTAYSYVANGGKQDNKGIELLVKYAALESAKGFIRKLSPFANLAYSDFKYVGFSYQTLNAARTAAIIADYSGNKVAGVAPVTANLGIDVITRPGLYGNLAWSYKDGMPITSDGTNQTTSYHLLNTKIGFQRSLSSRFDMDLYFGENNITGTQYYYMVFVNQLPDAYIPAPYRANYFGGLNIRYHL